MIRLALKMLINDRAKYLGLIIGITFATLLICQQASIFVGALSQTVSIVRDVGYGDIWVSRQGVETMDFSDPLRETDLLRVRGVEGVATAVPLYVGAAVTRTQTGTFRQVIVVGLDDHTLLGGPGRMIFGELADLRQQDAVIIDTVARRELFSGQVEGGESFEINRRRVRVVGLAQSSPQFSGMAVIYTRRSVAAQLTAEPNYAASWILVTLRPGESADVVAHRISERTGLSARVRGTLATEVIDWYRKNSGITEVLGLAILLGIVVGTVIVGQTFYMFAVENLRHFAAMKAIGLGNGMLLAMLLAQAAFVGLVGCGLGLGLTGGFFVAFASDDSPLRGMSIPWQVGAITAGTVLGMTLLAALLSARRVLTADPAMVFRA